MAYSDEPREMFKAVCSDCGRECEVPFKPTEGKPVRCPDCFKKSRPSNGRRSFNSRDSGNRFGGRRNNTSRFGGSNDRPREMHKAKCADCGKECEVPFKPTGDKPVYCRDCYMNHRN